MTGVEMDGGINLGDLALVENLKVQMVPSLKASRNSVLGLNKNSCVASIIIVFPSGDSCRVGRTSVLRRNSQNCKSAWNSDPLLASLLTFLIV